MIKSDSIIELINSLNINDSEYDKIDSITINKFNCADEILNTYIPDILNFKNLKNLTLNNLSLTETDLECIESFELNTLKLIDCELIENISSKFSSLKTHNLILDNVENLDTLYLGEYDSLVVKNINYNYNEKNIKKLDLSKATFNVDILTDLCVENLIISLKDYNLIKDKKFNYKLTIMEDNTNFIWGEV